MLCLMKAAHQRLINLRRNSVWILTVRSHLSQYLVIGKGSVDFSHRVTEVLPLFFRSEGCLRVTVHLDSAVYEKELRRKQDEFG